MPCHGDFERYESCSQALRGCSRSLRVFHNLLVSGADEDDILEHLKSMRSSMTIVEDETSSAASTMKCPLAEKQDFKGRTILVNAIRGNYPRVVEQLLTEKVHLGDALTHAVDCRNHLLASTLLEYAATNGLLQGKAIPINKRNKRKPINHMESLNGTEAKEDNHDREGLDVHRSEFDCSIHQRYHCKPDCDTRNSKLQSTATHTNKPMTMALGKAAKLITAFSVDKTTRLYHHFHVLEEDLERPFESAFFTKEEVSNPLIRACLLDDYEMILLLLEYGFVVWDQQRVYIKRNHYPTTSMMIHGPFESTQSRYYPFHPNCHDKWFASFNCLTALCSPSYINLTESRTVMRCLELAGRFRRQAHRDADHADVFVSLEQKCVSYATELLNVSRDDDSNDGDGDDPKCALQELDTVLEVCCGKAKLSPLIETAVNNNITEFFTHEKCYKFIERMWDPFNENSVPDLKELEQETNGTRNYSIALLWQLFCMVGVLMEPILTLVVSPLLYFYQQPFSNKILKMQGIKMDLPNSPIFKASGYKWQKFKHQVDIWLKKKATPRLSFAHYGVTHLVFCGLILDEIMKYSERNMSHVACWLDVKEYVILFWVVAISIQLIELIILEKRSFWHDYWNIHSMITMILFVAAFAAFTIPRLPAHLEYRDTLDLGFGCGSMITKLNSLDETNKLWPSSNYTNLLKQDHFIGYCLHENKTNPNDTQQANNSMERSNTNNTNDITNDLYNTSNTDDMNNTIDPDRVDYKNKTYHNVCKLTSRVYWKEQRFPPSPQQIADGTAEAHEALFLKFGKHVILPENIFKIACLMLFCQIAQFFQLHKALGTMNLMLVKTIRYIAYFAAIFFLYTFCFALGIQMTYASYKGMWQITLSPFTNLPECQKIESKFVSFMDTFINLFWTLFGYGDVQNMRIFLPNLRFPKEYASDPDNFLDPENMRKFREELCEPGLTKVRFREIMAKSPLKYSQNDTENDFNFAPNVPLSYNWTGELFFALYHIFAIVVMLNLLVALMSNGFERVNESAHIQWKASKARLRLRFIHMGFVVQPPMNLIAYPIRFFVWIWKQIRKHKDQCQVTTYEDGKHVDIGSNKIGADNGIGLFRQRRQSSKRKPFLSPSTRRKVQDRLHRRYMNAMEQEE